jgi:glycosyltransferase involved in cell wall biosynthesis
VAVGRRLLIVVNVGWFFVSHRLPIALAARADGYEVHVAAALDGDLDQTTEAQLREAGLHFHRMEFSRSGSHPLHLLRDAWMLLRLYAQVRPTVIHLVTLKPLLLGGIIARMSRRRAVVLAVPGRGSVFSATGALAWVRRQAALSMYRLAYARTRNRIIVQNEEDRRFFVDRRIFAAADVRLIRGSGVDLSRFRPRPEHAGRMTVVLASRMLREKGVADFVEAAQMLRRRGSDARFALVGVPDHGNPHSHTAEELQRWHDEGRVEWWGHRADMNAVFAESSIVCLPTYYGEGVPKVLIEAAACGRPIVTTDTAGCRDIVRNGENGLLVKPRDVGELAAALDRLLSDASLRVSMGARGREWVEAEFDVALVVGRTLQIYEELAR